VKRPHFNLLSKKSILIKKKQHIFEVLKFNLMTISLKMLCFDLTVSYIIGKEWQNNLQCAKMNSFGFPDSWGAFLLLNMIKRSSFLTFPSSDPKMIPSSPCDMTTTTDIWDCEWSSSEKLRTVSVISLDGRSR
jgi:hypothetical protein